MKTILLVVVLLVVAGLALGAISVEDVVGGIRQIVTVVGDWIGSLAAHFAAG